MIMRLLTSTQRNTTRPLRALILNRQGSIASSARCLLRNMGCVVTHHVRAASEWTTY